MAGAAEESSRAGRYVRQMTGYRAFIPAPLPPEPPLDLTGELQRLLSSADRALGRLDGSVLTLPNPDLFVFTEPDLDGGHRQSCLSLISPERSIATP